MNQKQKKILCGVCAFLLLLVYLLIKAKSGSWVQLLYEQGRFELLNQISLTQGNQSLDFYLGVIQENFFGPLIGVISGVFLILCALNFFSGASAVRFGAGVFIFLLLTKWEVLTFPPYGDAIGGPFAEALWLYHNHFNYRGLAGQEGYINGGPKVYFFTIYPAYLALLMKLTPSVKWFLAVNHLLVFAMAATIVSVGRELFLQVLERRTAILASLVILALPLFQSQSEAINMEMPGLFFSMLALAALSNRQVSNAGIFSVLALLSKDTGMITCLTVGFLSFVLLLIEEKSKRLKILFWGIMWPAFFVGLKLLSAFWVTYSHSPAAGRVSFAAGWPSIKSMEGLWLYSVSLLILFVELLRQKRGRNEAWFKNILQNHFTPLVLFGMAGLWFVFFLNIIAFSYRYRLLLLPFLVFCAVYSWTRILKHERLTQFLLVVIILFSFFGSYGYLYGSMLENDHVLLERSLEYRNDLFLNMKMAKDLETQYPQMTFGAPFVIAQILALPELGYVTKKLDVVIYGMGCTYGGIKNFSGLKELNLRQTLWVGVRSYIFGDMPYPVDEKDQIIKQYEVGNKKASLFVGGVAIERMRVALNYMNALKERAKVTNQAE